MWLLFWLAVVVAVCSWINLREIKKEKETLLGMVAALLARNPQELKCYIDLLRSSDLFTVDELNLGFGGDRRELSRQLALMKEGLRRVDLYKDRVLDAKGGS